MKKYFLFALMTLALTSCEEDVTDNTPAFESFNNYNYWRAQEKTATVKDGALIVSGSDETDKLELRIEGYELGKEYIFAQHGNISATYTKKIDDVVYTYKSSNNAESGYIKINSVDNQIPGAISGTFLIELLPVGNMIPNTPKIHFNKGVFYQIPLTN